MNIMHYKKLKQFEVFHNFHQIFYGA